MSLSRKFGAVLTALSLVCAWCILAPAPARAEYQWTFRSCDAGYTDDELAYFGGPYLQAFTPEFNGRDLSWLEPNENFITHPDTWNISPSIAWVGANITLTQAGQYVLIMEYTPFVYDVEYLDVTSPTTRYLLFVPFSVPLSTATIQVQDENGRAVGEGVEVDFPGWSPDVDPYSAITDQHGQIDLRCLSRARVAFPSKQYNPFPNIFNVYVNDPTYGQFCNWVNIPTSGSEIDIKLKPGACNDTSLFTSHFRIGNPL